MEPRPRKLHRSVSVLAFALALGAGGSIAAQTRVTEWDRQKGNCDAILAAPEQAPLAELKYCAALWESYRDVSTLKPGEREAAAAAFQRLYREGDEEGRHIARNALARLGFTPAAESPEELEKKRLAAQQAPGRKKYRPHTAEPADQKAAQKLRAQAYKAYKKGDFRGALAILDEALQRDPAYVQALYDAACCYARLGDRANAVEYLMRLADIGNKEALARLRKARSDNDFREMRDDPGYKKTTGYARVKVFNGMPPADKEVGEDNVFALIEMLRNPKLGYEVVEGGDDRHVRDRPHIWYKEHSKLQAYVIRKLIGHPRARLVPIPPNKETDFDILVSWADKVEANQFGEKSTKYGLTGGGGGQGSGGGPSLNPEKRVDQALREQDEALRQPEEYARKTEQVIGTPERIQNKAEGAVDRVESTVKTMERVGDKAGKVFR